MADKEKENLEYGLPSHENMAINGESLIMGTKPYSYHVDGKEWGKIPKDWTLKEATAVAVNSNDEVIVFNRGTKPIIVFDTDGNYLNSWGENIFTNAHGISVDDENNIYCVDSGDNTVRKFDSYGKLIFQIGKEGEKAEKMSGIPFAVPTQVAIDSNNQDLYVADGYSNAKVHKYNKDGKYLFSWGESGTGEGQFNIVHNISTDSEGLVYVADRENHRIQVFDKNGNYLDQWINLSRAACLYIDKRGKEDIFYVGEYFSGIASNDIGINLGPRISIFNKSGKLLSRVGIDSYGPSVGRFYSPHGISVDSKGNIFVAEVSYSDYGQFMNPKRELRSLQKLTKIN
tara:strand:+ start:134 stop:1162 length:1029 start_codon:yes stop_codon:yes gene_type:complete